MCTLKQTQCSKHRLRVQHGRILDNSMDYENTYQQKVKSMDYVRVFAFVMFFWRAETPIQGIIPNSQKEKKTHFQN